ncbi:hypothetical protein BDR07DRAFT_1549141 [Suillus spraguei]|nr:hypothetical protein BDR07DRAFT_1549141 [Suillus spraguei]
MSIHEAFHETMEKDIEFDAAKIMELFDKIKDNLNYHEVINNILTRNSFPNVVERIKYLRDKSTAFLDKQLTVSYQGMDCKFETLFDLVGWIFSVTGLIPDDATAADYYHPLVILYGQWCQTLLGKKDKQPQVVQITWFTQESIKRVCLGSSLDKPKKARKDSARENILVPTGLAKEDERNKSYMPGDEGQLIGHCAETFPALLIKLLGNKVALADVGGVAVKPFEALKVEDKLAIPDMAVRKKLLENPCANCKVILLRLGNINLDNFSTNNF